MRHLPSLEKRAPPKYNWVTKKSCTQARRSNQEGLRRGGTDRLTRAASTAAPLIYPHDMKESTPGENEVCGENGTERVDENQHIAIVGDRAVHKPPVRGRGGNA